MQSETEPQKKPTLRATSKTVNLGRNNRAFREEVLGGRYAPFFKGANLAKALLLSHNFPPFDGAHACEESLVGSPLAPTRSSELLRFWGEDPIRESARIAEQFWGDIFAELLQALKNLLTPAFPA